MHKAHDEETAVILKVGAEGGSLTIQGQQDADGSWRFRCLRNEVLFAGLLPGELSSNDLFSVDPWVYSWDEALVLFDRYPWARLYPVELHPDFARPILDAVRVRLQDESEPNQSRQFDRWQSACCDT